MKLVSLVLGLTACGRAAPTMDREAAAKLFDDVTVVAAPPGMSDLTIDEAGTLWAISERDRKVVSITMGTGRPGPVSSTPRNGRHLVIHPVVGVPDGIDTEGIASLGGGKFALALEGAHIPLAGVAFAELRGKELVLTHTRQLSPDELGVAPTINHGMESACGRGDEVLVASEPVGTLADGTRWSALVRLRGDELGVTKLRLTTAEGKISAMHCTLADDGTAEVIAIERHYGVCRILRFTARRGDAEITPTVELDLAPVIRDALNVEGIAKLPDGRLVAINDNQGKRPRGPTKLLVFHPR